MRILLICFLLTFSARTLEAQYFYQHINSLNNIKEEADIYLKKNEIHSAIRPLNRRQIDTVISTLPAGSPENKSWLNRKAWHEHLVKVEDEKYAITIDPLVNFQMGFEQGEEDYRYMNTRGYLIEGRIGKNLSFYSTFLENQGRFADYISQYAARRKVIPGQSSPVRSFGEGAYDFGYVAGEVSYNPSEFFVFTAGQGRNFFGEGYRSMLLSDGGFSYPFFRIETTFWRFKYVNLWTQMYDIRNSVAVSPVNYARKYLSSHYLSININSRLNISVFEAIMVGDTSQQEGLDASFLNPIIFYRPVEFAVGSRNGNALLGAAFSYKTFDQQMLYGQFVLDEFQLSSILAQEGSWVNKYGLQLGYKWYDAFNVEGLFQRFEYNTARPHTYQHREVLTNYAHYGSPLAHPWGANFHEFIYQAIYQQNRWEGDLQFNFGRLGADAAGSNWGSDIYLSYETREQDLGNEIAQGLSANYFYLQARAAYLINPASNLKFELGIRYRNFSPEVTEGVKTSSMLNQESAMLIFGLRTEMFNRYYDL
jgi:hypothetical protein